MQWSQGMQWFQGMQWLLRDAEVSGTNLMPRFFIMLLFTKGCFGLLRGACHTQESFCVLRGEEFSCRGRSLKNVWDVFEMRRAIVWGDLMLVSKRPKFDTFDLIDTLPQSISMWLKTFQKYINISKSLLRFQKTPQVWHKLLKDWYC